jgi:2-polyprenyl-6-methoxyphenol hydroxylase-like FAD-dependent oxidoreductase
VTSNPDAIIVGAGPAGLACAVTMHAAGLDATVLEKADRVGAVWRRHYDRLHLHTDRNHSGLPDMAMPRAFPAYPSRAQLVEYLEAYTAHFRIKPVFNTDVSRVRRDGALWCAEGNQRTMTAPVVVVATGIADAPYRPTRPGLEIYSGALVHGGDTAIGSVCGKAGAGRQLRRSGGESRSILPMPASMSRWRSAIPSDPAARSARISNPVVGDPVPCPRVSSRVIARRWLRRGRQYREARLAPRGRGRAGWSRTGACR